MTLQDIINDMEQEIEHLQFLINKPNLKSPYLSKLTGKRLTISKYLHYLKELNVEDLKRDEKSICQNCEQKVDPVSMGRMCPACFCEM